MNFVDPPTTIETLAADERAAAMTEFAITLPVFLVFFGAIMGMGNLTQGAIQTHVDAAPQLWTDVYLAEEVDEFVDTEESIFFEPPDVEGMTIREYDDGPEEFVVRQDDVTGIMKTADDATSHVDGLWGESSETIMEMESITGIVPPVEIHTDPLDDNLIGTDSMGARAIADDRASAMRPDSGGSIFGDAVNDMFDNAELESNSAWVAGTRYGAVVADNEMEFEPGYGLPVTEYEVHYTSRISPTWVPHYTPNVDGVDAGLLDAPEQRAWLATRMWIDDVDEYSRLFELGDGSRLDIGQSIFVNPYD